ncbi:MAG: DUF4276 family protein [Candidatus Pacebacteria bacterium]|nr:DUF4276 family protein [Candidatus Paceibacterota bacterium]
MSARIYIEGGGDSKELRARCREAFRKLLEKCGFQGRMPKLSACGSRESAYDDFVIAHSYSANGDYVALLVDSEDPVADSDKPWQHLSNRDGWKRPEEADDEQVFLMATCMETWIVCDRESLRKRYPGCLQESALPASHGLERRDRHAIQTALENATRDCKGNYSKGKRSFQLLGLLDPSELRSLKHFSRMERVLEDRL